MYTCWSLLTLGDLTMIVSISEESAVQLAKKNPTDIYFFAELG